MNFQEVWPVILPVITLVIGWFKDNLLILLKLKREQRDLQLEHIARQNAIYNSALDTVERLEGTLNKYRDINAELRLKQDEMAITINRLLSEQQKIEDLNALYEESKKAESEALRLIKQIREECECGKAIAILKKRQL